MLNLSIFSVEDPSGKFYKEGWVLKNFPNEWEYVDKYCKDNNLTDITFKEKVYCTINQLKQLPKCKNPECKNSTKYVNSKIGYREYCSSRCISNDPYIKLQKEKKSLEKFGTKTPAESILIKNKIIETNNQLYGGNSPMSKNEIKEKSKKTLLKNWGVDNPNKSESIVKKRIESFKKSNYKESYRKKSLEKYGVEHPWMSKEIHKKTIEFFYQSYKERIISRITNKQILFKDFEYNSKNLKFECKVCDKDFEIKPYQFYYRSSHNPNHICTNCFPISDSSSLMQLDLLNFIRTYYQGEIVENQKNIISPYEIDIYLPFLKIGFEFNGLWWHSDNFKERDYHQKKWKLSEEKDIQIITIWEDDWVMKNDICKSFIINKLGLNIKKFYARKCDLRIVPYKESFNFLNENHFQGDCKSSVRIGLYFNNELVSLMTFGKLRLPLSSKSVYNDWELLRFVNLKNSNCVGSASKLLKYFINTYKPDKIISYSDNLISNGSLYKKLGFTHIHTSSPGYWYVIDEKREHRFNFRKSILVKKGHDSSKTESEIMSEMGYYRIYNAGNKRWELNF